MPIKDLSDVERFPRLGKIHLGTKHPEKGYPMKADHFVFPKDHPHYAKMVELFGEEPKEIRILIPTEDDEQWATQYYKSYNQTYGLVCKGDGELAMRMVDVITGKLPTANKAGTVSLHEMECLGRDCPEYQAKKCHEVMNLKFIIPELPGLGVWQIDTGSKNSILNINSCARIIKRAFGHISLIPLKLTFEPMPVNNPEDGKKQTVYVLNLRTDVTMAQLAEQAREQSQRFKIEAPDFKALAVAQIEQDIDELFGEKKTEAHIELATEEDIVEEPPVQTDEERAQVVIDKADKVLAEREPPAEKLDPTGLKPDMTFGELLDYVKANKKTESWLFKNVGMTVDQAQADPYTAAITIKELAGW